MKNKYFKFQKKKYDNLIILMNKIEIDIENNKDDMKNEIDDEFIKNDKNIKCIICKQNNSKYMCPNCKIFYCSIDCYKKHNNECIEKFYKKNCEEELKSIKINEKDVKNFKKNIKNYYFNIQNDFNISDKNILNNKNIERYEKILNKIKKNEFKILQEFNYNDWNNFYSFIKNEQINFEDKFGKIYKPYWYRNNFNLFIYDTNYFKNYNETDLNIIKNFDINLYKNYFNKDNIDNENCNNNIIININNEEIYINDDIINKSLILKYKEIKNLKSITKKEPNNLNIYQLILIVCCIIYIFRNYNGKIYNHYNNEIINNIFYLLPLLYDKNYKIKSTLKENLKDFEIILKNLENHQYYLNILKLIYSDLKIILKNYKNFLFESLIRLYNIIHFYSLKEEINKNYKELTIKCKNSKYKLIYFMSYIKYIDINYINNIIIEFNKI